MSGEFVQEVPLTVRVVVQLSASDEQMTVGTLEPPLHPWGRASLQNVKEVSIVVEQLSKRCQRATHPRS